MRAMNGSLKASHAARWIPHLLLLGVLGLSACSAAKKYERYSQECDKYQAPRACFLKGHYAARLKRDADAYAGYKEGCELGYKKACERLKKSFPKGAAEVAPPESTEPFIHWRIHSDPEGAEIAWRIESKSPEVAAVLSTPFAKAPFEETRQLIIEGLTKENAREVKVILGASAPGYQPQERAFTARTLLKKKELSVDFELEKL